MDFALRLSIEGREDVETVRGSFEPDEWHLLSRFGAEVDRLVTTEWFKTGAKVHLSVSGTRDGFTGVEVDMPPDDTTAAFLHRVRPFVLQQEEFYLPKVAKVLKHRLRHPAFATLIEGQLDLFLGREFQRQVKITSNGVVMNSEDIVRKWCNAFEYHRDRDKQVELEELHRIMPLRAGRALFLSMMIDKAKAVQALASVVALLGSQPGESIQFRAPGLSRDTA
jgi:hypothetical protein